MTRAALYCRISRADADVPKVENQERQLRSLAEAQGYEVVAVFIDDGISAYKVDVERPDFDRLLAFIEGDGCDVVLAMADDRLTRGGGLEALKFGAHCAEYGVKTHTDREGLRDPSDDVGELLTFLGGWKAQQEVKSNIKRQKDANAALRAKGEPRRGGGRPFGFEPDKVTIRQAEAALIREGTRMILGGEPRWDVVKLFNASGIPTTRTVVRCPDGTCDRWKVPEKAKCPSAESHTRVASYKWRASSVYDILTRARNAGLIEYEGALVNDDTRIEAIITPDELDSVRVLLAEPVRTIAGKPTKTLMSGLVRCHCGEIMHAHAASEQGIRVYRCKTMNTQWDRTDFPGRHTAIKIALLDHAVRAAVIESYFSDDTNDAKDGEARTLADLHRKLTNVREKKNRLIEMYTDGHMTKPEMAKRSMQIDAEDAAIRGEIGQLVRGSAHAKMVAQAREAVLKHLVVTPMEANGSVIEFKQLPKERSVEVREEIGAAFDALSLDEQRAVVAATLAVIVAPGRGARRVSFIPKELTVRGLAPT